MNRHALDRYTPDCIEDLWTDEKKFSCMLKVEKEVLRAQSKYSDSVPSDLDLDALDEVEVSVERIRELEEETKHETAAFVDSIEEQLSEPLSQWIHFGVTSSDILDTANGLRFKECKEVFHDEYSSLKDTLNSLSDEYEDVEVMSRTHGEPARPISLGKVFHRWKRSLGRTFSDVLVNLGRLSACMITGTNGDFPNISEEVNKQVAKRLHLRPLDDISTTQIVPRSRHAGAVQSFALYMSVVEKIATDLRLYHNRGEIKEGFDEGQKGSSSMPHKENPILCENLCGLSRQVRSGAQPALENVALWHERDMSHSSVERFQIPQTSSLSIFATQRLRHILFNLVVNEDECEERISNCEGWKSQDRMIELIREEGMARQEAYDQARKEFSDDG